jgi:hypothetical protein
VLSSLTAEDITTMEALGWNPVQAVPEPEIDAMLGIGLGLMGWIGRRRTQQAA